MNPTDVVPFFRTWWESRLTNSGTSCLVKRPSSEVFNETTGTYDVTYSTCYSGACLVRPSSHDDEQSGERQVEIRYYNLFLPHTATDIQPDDLVDITSTTDSLLNGLQMVVRNVSADAYVTRRAVRVEEVVGG